MCENGYEVVNEIQLVMVGCSGEFHEHSHEALGTTKERNFVTLFVTVTALWRCYVCFKSLRLDCNT